MEGNTKRGWATATGAVTIFYFAYQVWLVYAGVPPDLVTAILIFIVVEASAVTFVWTVPLPATKVSRWIGTVLVVALLAWMSFKPHLALYRREHVAMAAPARARPRTHEEVVDGFERLYRELRTSNEAFDQYDAAQRDDDAKTEATKMATEIAQMTDGSPSLLAEYGAAEIRYRPCLSTVPPYAAFFIQPGVDQNAHGMRFLNIECGRVGFQTLRHHDGGDASPNDLYPPNDDFNHWWNRFIYLTKACGRFTRADIVHAVADATSSITADDKKKLFDCVNSHNPDGWIVNDNRGKSGIVENSDWPYYMRAISGELVTSLQSGMMSLRPR